RPNGGVKRSGHKHQPTGGDYRSAKRDGTPRRRRCRRSAHRGELAERNAPPQFGGVGIKHIQRSKGRRNARRAAGTQQETSSHAVRRSHLPREFPIARKVTASSGFLAVEAGTRNEAHFGSEVVHRNNQQMAVGIVCGAAPRHTTDVADRKSTRLNSSHVAISYAVFCLKKKKKREYTESSTMYSVR